MALGMFFFLSLKASVVIQISVAFIPLSGGRKEESCLVWGRGAQPQHRAAGGEHGAHTFVPAA